MQRDSRVVKSLNLVAEHPRPVTDIKELDGKLHYVEGRNTFTGKVISVQILHLNNPKVPDHNTFEPLK